MTTMRRLLLLGLALGLTACGGGTTAEDLWKNATINKAKERGRLIIATEPKFRPFEYMDGDQLVGFDIDLAKTLAAEMKVEVEFVPTDFDGIIATLQTGKVDLIISGMTATPERALRVSYSDPYYHTVTCLLLSKERASDVKTVEDLNRKGRRVVVKLGTTGQEAANAHCPNAEISPLRDDDLAAQEVALGRADALIYDFKQIQIYSQKFKDTTFAIFTPVSVEPYAIACRKGDPETIAWINLVLHHMRRDGRLKELYDKHGLEDYYEGK